MFEDSKLKVERAKKHVSDLQIFLSAFFQPDCYRFIHGKDPETGRNFLKFELLKQVPSDAALFIGDAIHNLRSALDIVYYSAVAKSGGKPTDFSRFPFDETREALVGPLRGGSIKHSTDLQTLILDKVQPYKTGNYPLWALHQLNIIDKHQLLIPFAQASAIIGVDADVGPMKLRQATFGVSDGATINAISAAGTEIKIYNYGKPAFDVLFKKGLPMEGQAVIPTLLLFADVVGCVIEAFEIFFAVEP
jgi:hypothetical protein